LTRKRLSHVGSLTDRLATSDLKRVALSVGRLAADAVIASRENRSVEIITSAGQWAEPGLAGATYVEQFATADLSIGTYSLRAGAIDTQSPHTEDEVYVVTAGRAHFTGGDRTVEVGPGTVLFVAATEPHRFHDITEDLVLLVFFGPSEGSRST
jgi:mannose-6-phosphate isomerase-like protein (cupin superfamily)